MRLIDADAFIEENKDIIDCEIDHPKYQDTLRELIDQAPTVERPHGKWKEDSDDYDVRCSHCGLAIHALNKTNHEMLNVLTGGKWWTHYRYCPMCGSINGGEAE